MNESTGDDELRKYLSRADRESSVPAEFRERLWEELQGVLGESDQDDSQDADDADDPMAMTGYAAGTADDVRGESASEEPQEFATVTPLQAPPAPTGRSYWRVAVAAAVALFAVGIAALVLRNEPVDLATEQQSEEAPPATSDSGVPNDDTDEASITTTTSPPELGFATNLGLTEVTGDSVEFTFAANTATAYNATIREGEEVIATEGGSAEAGETVVLDIGRLEAARSYTVDVTLIGPPPVRSERLMFRTPADQSEPGSFDVPISIDSAMVNSDGTIDVVTNLCSTVSYVLLDPADQRELGRSATDEDNADAPCETAHQLELADAETTIGQPPPYVVIIEVEESLARAGTGNVAVTTVNISGGS